MSRGLALLVAAAVLLGSLSPAARAQGGAGGDGSGGERGPGALWDAYPLEERPRATGADGERAAPAPSSPGSERVAFRRQEPAGFSPLMAASLLCLGAGLLLSAGGLLLARRRAEPARGGRRWRSSP